MVCFIQIKRLSFQKLAKVAQTKKQMNRSNRLACGYSIIRAADIHRFLGLSMLRQYLRCSSLDQEQADIFNIIFHTHIYQTNTTLINCLHTHLIVIYKYHSI